MSDFVHLIVSSDLAKEPCEKCPKPVKEKCSIEELSRVKHKIMSEEKP